ncbi:MAG: hypothetical protein KKG09_03705 [Verrucomicrobia bacterium]|nr:hypothetical protein [Verrucomicrobiota bacterium]MBU4497095.1 hypothetical protein [Verrucomicrobiota bacterium]
MKDIGQHNKQVARLWNDYRLGRNERVPVVLAFDEQFILPRWDCSFARYYSDVQSQIEIQLQSQDWIIRNIVHDKLMEPPVTWQVCPPNWMAENEFLGAEVVTQENDYSWSHPLDLPKPKLLAMLRGIDVTERIQESTLYRQYTQMKEITRGMEFQGRPVEVGVPVIATHGVFTKTAEIRGLEQICLDFMDDPPFARELLECVTDILTARIVAWHRLLGTGREFPNSGGWGMADDSIAMISREHYESFVLPCHRKFYQQMTTGARSIHLCGRAQHLFQTLHANLGINTFNGPGPKVVDLMRMIQDIGEPVVIETEVGHATLLGSREKIEQEVSAILRAEIKERATITLTGYVPVATPLSSIEFFYDCGVKYGQLDQPPNKV